MTTKEKAFLKYKGGNINTKQNLLNEFQNAQQIFYKQLRTSERAYNSEKINQIEACSTTNPKEFWNHLKKLGPRVSRKTPVKVQTENEYITNETDILHEWKTEFSKLLNDTNDAYYDNQFLSNVDRSLFHFETEMETENFVQNAMINTDVTPLISQNCNCSYSRGCGVWDGWQLNPSGIRDENVSGFSSVYSHL